jgi:phosphoglycolate phosphatase
VTLPDLVVLDLAGTTVEDRGQVPEAFAAALAEHGLAVSPEQLAAVRGSSKREAIAALVPPGDGHAARSASAYAAFQRALSRRYDATGVRAVAGAEDAVRWLAARGVRVALDTGFDRAITDLLLERLGWRTGFADAVVCGDDVAHGRPAPDLILAAMQRTAITDPSRVASVGDTTLDLRAGAAARVRWNVGVLSGAHPRARLETAPHTHLVDSVAALPSLFGETR